MKLINKAKSCSRNIALVVGLAGIASTGCVGPMVAGYGAARGNPGVYEFGRAYTQLEAAERGRSNQQVIIVNNGGGSAEPEDPIYGPSAVWMWGPDGKAYAIKNQILIRQYKAKGYTMPTEERRISIGDGTEIHVAPPLTD